MKISEVAKETGFSTSTIRYYEQQGLIRDIERDKHGIRTFSQDDIKWIKFLASIKNARLSLNEMMSYADLYYSKNESIPDRLAVTKECREKLMAELNELRKGIEFLDYKIEYYNELIERRKRKYSKNENISE